MAAGRLATRTGDPGSDAADSHRWRALAVLAMLQAVIVMDGTMVNVALPAVQRDLGSTIGELSWVINGYLLAGGGLLLFGGRLADLLGRRRILLTGATVFGLSSLACGLAASPGVLIAARFAQGLGEALTLPAALSVIALLFPEPGQRHRAMGIWGAVTGVAATAGGVLSGIATALASWRLLFFLNVPVVAAALILVPRLVPRSNGPRRGVDLIGALLVTGGLVAVVDGLLSAADHPWTGAAVLGPLLGGFAALGLFVLVEARRAEPLVPGRIFRNRTRVAANLVSICVMGVMSAMFLLITLHLADALGFSPLWTGLAMLPSGLAFVAGASVAGRLAALWGEEAVLACAAGAGAGGMAVLALTIGHGGYLTGVLPGFLIASAGIGAAHPGLQTAALHGVSADDAGLASGIQVSVQSVSKAVGIAVLVPLAVRAGEHAPARGGPVASGDQLAFAVAAGVLAIGAVLVLTLTVSRTHRDSTSNEETDPRGDGPDAIEPA